MYSLLKSIVGFSYSLLKIGFWLCLVLLILPINVEDNGGYDRPQVSADQTIGAAQDLYNEVSGFCVRVPSVCETGVAIVELIGQKAKAAAQIAVSYLNDSETLDEENLSADNY